VQLDKQVNAALRTAKSALKHGNPTSADKHLQKLQTIRPEDEVPKARALAALMKRDFNAALAFYRTVKKHDGAGE
jgi:Flp pilus assembly protein TadD